MSALHQFPVWRWLSVTDETGSSPPVWPVTLYVELLLCFSSLPNLSAQIER